MDTTVFKMTSADDVQKLSSALEGQSSSDQKFSVKQFQYSTKGFIRIAGKKAHLSIKMSGDRPAIATVTVHLSHFKSFNDFQSSCENCINFEPGWMERTEIRRLDIAVDIGADAEFLALSAIVPRVRRCLVIKTTGVTVCLGRPPRQVEIYMAQPGKLRQVDFPLDLGEVPNAARIEIRHYPGRLPIQKLSELPKVRHLNPFANLEFYNLDQATATSTKGREKVHFAAFSFAKQELGTQGALLFLKTSRSLHRDIRKKLIRMPKDFLDQAWKNRRERFFGAEGGPEDVG